MSSGVSPLSNEEKQLTSIEKELSHVNKEIKRLTDRRNQLILLKDKLKDEILLKKSNTHCSDDWDKNGLSGAYIPDKIVNTQNIGCGDHNSMNQLFRAKNFIASSANYDTSKFTTNNSCRYKLDSSQLLHNQKVLSQTIANDIFNALGNGLKGQHNHTESNVDRYFYQEVKKSSTHFFNNNHHSKDFPVKMKSNAEFFLPHEKTCTCSQQKENLEITKENILDSEQNKIANMKSSMASFDLVKINNEFQTLKRNYGDIAKSSNYSLNKNENHCKVRNLKSKMVDHKDLKRTNADYLINKNEFKPFLEKIDNKNINNLSDQLQCDRKYTTHKNEPNDGKNHLLSTDNIVDHVDEQKVLCCIFDRHHEIKDDDNSSWEDIEDEHDNDKDIKSATGSCACMKEEFIETHINCQEIIKEEVQNQKFINSKESNEKLVKFLDKEENGVRFRIISGACEKLKRPLLVETRMTQNKADSSKLKDVMDNPHHVSKNCYGKTAQLFSLESLQALQNVLDSTSKVTVPDSFHLKNQTCNVNCVLALEKQEGDHRLNQAESISKLSPKYHKNPKKKNITCSNRTSNREQTNEDMYTLLSIVKSPSVETMAFADQNSVLKMSEDSSPAESNVPQYVYPNKSALMQNIDKYIAQDQYEDSTTLALAQDPLSRSKCHRRKFLNTNLNRESSVSVFNTPTACLSTCSTNNQFMSEIESKILQKYLSCKSIESSNISLNMPNENVDQTNICGDKNDVRICGDRNDLPTPFIPIAVRQRDASKICDLVYCKPSMNLPSGKEYYTSTEHSQKRNNLKRSEQKRIEPKRSNADINNSKKGTSKRGILKELKCSKLLPCRGAGDCVCSNIDTEIPGTMCSNLDTEVQRTIGPPKETTMLRLNHNTAIDLKDNSGDLKMLNARNCSSSLCSDQLSSRRQYETLLIEQFRYEEQLIDEKYRRIIKKRRGHTSNNRCLRKHHDIANSGKIINDDANLNNYDETEDENTTKDCDFTGNFYLTHYEDVMKNHNFKNCGEKTEHRFITHYADMTNIDSITKNFDIATYRKLSVGRKTSNHGDLTKDCTLKNNGFRKNYCDLKNFHDFIKNSNAANDHNITLDRKVGMPCDFKDEPNFKPDLPQSFSREIAVTNYESVVKKVKLDRFHTHLGLVTTAIDDDRDAVTVRSKIIENLDDQFKEDNGIPKDKTKENLFSEKREFLLTQPDCVRTSKIIPCVGSDCNILTNNEIDGYFKQQIIEYSDKIDSLLKEDTVIATDQQLPVEMGSDFKAVFDQIKELRLKNDKSSELIDPSFVVKKYLHEGTSSWQSYDKKSKKTGRSFEKKYGALPSANCKVKKTNSNKDVLLKTIARLVANPKRKQQILPKNSIVMKNEKMDLKNLKKCMINVETNFEEKRSSHKKISGIKRRVTKMYSKCKKDKTDSKNQEEYHKTDQIGKEQPKVRKRKSKITRRVTIFLTKTKKTNKKASALQMKNKAKDLKIKKTYFSPLLNTNKRKRMSFWKTEKKTSKNLKINKLKF